jgi:hypothetical protein
MTLERSLFRFCGDGIDVLAIAVDVDNISTC